MAESKVCPVCKEKFIRASENNYQWYNKEYCSDDCSNLSILKGHKKIFWCVDCNKNISDCHFLAKRCKNCSKIINIIKPFWRKNQNLNYEETKKLALKFEEEKEEKKRLKKEKHTLYLSNLSRRQEFENDLDSHVKPFNNINSNKRNLRIKELSGEHRRKKRCSVCGIIISYSQKKKLLFCDNCLKDKRKNAVKKFYDEKSIIPEALTLINESKKFSRKYAREYTKRPEVREKLRKYAKNYLSRSEVKEKLKTYARKYNNIKRRNYETKIISSHYPIIYSFFIENKDDAFRLKDLSQALNLKRATLKTVLNYLINEGKIAFKKPYYSANINDEYNDKIWKYFEN